MADSQQPHLDPELRDLWGRLVQLHHARRQYTSTTYRRVNPFCEDLFDWKERGAYVFGPGRNITIYNSTTISGKVDVGDNTWIGPYCSLDGGAVGLTVGSWCSVSLGAQLLTHDTVKWALSAGRLAYDHAPVRIGDCCFIGTHAIVTKGVTVGDHCVIGAGAVVAKDVAPFSIVAGVPGRVIGTVALRGDGTVELEYFSNAPYGSD